VAELAEPVADVVGHQMLPRINRPQIVPRGCGVPGVVIGRPLRVVPAPCDDLVVCSHEFSVQVPVLVAGGSISGATGGHQSTSSAFS
jgi:hypothetical protein